MSTVAQPSEAKTFEQEQREQHQITHNRLVQRLLGSGANLPSFMAELARTQAAVVAGTEAVAFVIEPSPQGGPALKLVSHIREDNATQELRQQAQAAFRQLMQPCIEQNRDAAIQVGDESDTDGSQFCLVTLLRNENAIVAASAVICRCRNEALATQRLQAMQLVAGYFDLYTLRRSHEQSKQVAKSHQDVLQLASALANAEGFQQGGVALCNELAGRTGATRVSLGWIKGLFRGRDIVLQAISHTEEFDKKQELSVQLVKVMEECYDQQEIVQFDPAGRSTENTTREAQRLSIMEGGNRVVSLPLRQDHEIRGVLTLEFPKERPSTTQETTTLAVAAELLAPQLKDRYDNDRWLVTKSVLSSRELAAKAIGPKYMLGKVLALTALALVIFAFWPGLATYRVTAPFRLEPIEQRIVSTPIEGPIKEVFVKPGDSVKAGDPLLTIDVSQLQEEMFAAQQQAISFRAQAADAEEKGEMAQARAYQNRAEASEAQARVLQSKIDNATLTATIDGIVLEGRYQDRKGDVVPAYKEMFVIAPAEKSNLRAVLEVDERDIQDISLNSTGQLATRAEPSKKYDFTITDIVEQAEAKEGSSRYRVEARIEDEPNQGWYSGQQGQAKIEAGDATYAWVLTHRLVDFVRIKLWI